MTTTGGQQRVVAGRYRLEEALGSGGMGTVWRARDEVLHRAVAVKEVLLPSGVPEAERVVLRERSMREARAAAALTNPHVVTVYDVVEDADRPWIVMELVQARTLSEVIRDEGTLPPERVAAIGLDVLSALEAAHAAGITHRDVKPGNVLLADDGRVILTDFGIATSVGDSSLTSTGLIVGSPAYMSPERARGQKPGPASDLWSLGATLFSAACGASPFERGEPLPTLTAVTIEDPELPECVGPLREVIEGLLVKDPAARLDAQRTRALLAAVARPAPPAVHREQPVARTRTMPIPAAVASPASAPATSDGEGTTPPATPVPATAARAPASAQDRPSPASAEDRPASASGQDRLASSRPLPPAPRGERTQTVRPPPEAPAGGRRGTVVLVVVALAALLAGYVAYATLRGGDGDGDTAARDTGNQAPAQEPSDRERDQPRNNDSPSPNDEPSAQESEPAVAPDGFTTYTDPIGFSVAVPEGWVAEDKGSYVDFSEPDGRRFLRVDSTDQPRPDPVADWETQEGSVSQTLSGYERIGIEEADYRDYPAADWEFTWEATNGTLHVLNRGFVAGDRGYALYWSVPEEQWEESLPYFDVFAETFQPAP